MSITSLNPLLSILCATLKLGKEPCFFGAHGGQMADAVIEAHYPIARYVTKVGLLSGRSTRHIDTKRNWPEKPNSFGAMAGDTISPWRWKRERLLRVFFGATCADRAQD